MDFLFQPKINSLSESLSNGLPFFLLSFFLSFKPTLELTFNFSPTQNLPAKGESFQGKEKGRIEKKMKRNRKKGKKLRREKVEERREESREEIGWECWIK